jgi:hypothetical protein
MTAEKALEKKRLEPNKVYSMFHQFMTVRQGGDPTQ